MEGVRGELSSGQSPSAHDFRVRGEQREGSVSKDIHHRSSQGDPECPHPLPSMGHTEASALGQAGTGKWVEPGHSVTASDLRQKHLTAPGEGQASIPPSCALRYRVSAGVRYYRPDPGALGPWASGSQCWPARAKHCRPGLAAAQPRSLPTLQAGGTVPAARTAGSSFADVSEEVQGPGRAHPSPHPRDKAAPGPAGQRGWSFPPGSSEKGPRGQSLRFLRDGPLSRRGAEPCPVIKLEVPTSLGVSALPHPPLQLALLILQRRP